MGSKAFNVIMGVILVGIIITTIFQPAILLVFGYVYLMAALHKK